MKKLNYVAKKILFIDEKNSSTDVSEKQASLASKLSVSWLSPLINAFAIQQEAKKELKIEDIPDSLLELDAKQINNEFQHQVEKTRKRSKKSYLAKTIWSTNCRDLLEQILPMLIYTISLLVGPILLTKIIESVETPAGSTADGLVSTEWWITCIFYAVAFWIIKAIGSAADSIYWLSRGKLASKIDTQLVSFILCKAMKISSTSVQRFTTGESINVLSTHASRVKFVVHGFHMLWASILQIIMVFCMLANSMGISSLSAVVVLICLIPLNYVIQQKQNREFEEESVHTEKRVQVIQEICTSIRVIKMFVWENLFLNKVNNARSKEAQAGKRARMLLSITIMVWECIPEFILILCFVTHTWVLGRQLTPGLAFSTFLLVRQLASPMVDIPEAISDFMNAKLSLEKIEEFAELKEVSPRHDQPNQGKEDTAIELKDCTFTWDGEKNVLSKINMKVPAGSLVVVVGKFGSGKSSLLSSIIGETTKTEGDVFLDRSKKIVYVPQTSWIRNTTFKNNVLFGREVDNKKYQRVIDACALNTDINLLPEKDETEIGERGITISGGQKARVSLARALYADGDIYLLDDILAAVDAGVGKHILNNVILGGALKAKTRVLVTHKLHFVDQADHIIVVEEGKIREQGSYKELMEADGYLKYMMQEYSSKPSTSVPSSLRLLDETPNAEADDKEDNSEEEEEETEESIELPAGSRWKLIWTYLASYSLPTVALFINILLLRNCVQTAHEYWLSYWSSDPESIQHSLNYYAAGYIICGLLNMALEFVGSYIEFNISSETSKVYHTKMTESLLHAHLQYFEETPSGKVVSRFGQDLVELDSGISNKISSLVEISISSLTTIVYIVHFTPTILIFAVPMGFLYYVLQSYFQQAYGGVDTLNATMEGPILTHFSEVMGGLTSIRAYRAQELMEKESLRHQLNYYKAKCAMNLFYRWFNFRVDFLSHSILFISIILAMISISRKVGAAQIAAEASLLGILINRVMRLSSIFERISFIISDFQSAFFASFTRIQEVINAKQERYQGNANVDELWPKRGEIIVKNVQLRYREAHEPVLRGVNAIIPAGKKVAIVGRTGSGKTSLLSAILRLRELCGGSIEIDDQDISQVPLEKLRSSIAILPQEPQLFSGTIREALDQNAEYSDTKIWSTLDLVSMKEVIEKLPQGLAADIAENGSNFSTGERQLLCLARALLKDRRILILDEATASIDLETDAIIQKTLRSQFHNCTILCIAHRLETVMDYDQIIVMEKGQVVECDSPEKLLKSQQSRFYQMVHHQTDSH